MRGHIRRQSKSSWAVVVDIGRDPVTGKRKQKWFTVRGTKRDAENFLVEKLREINSGGYREPVKMTVGEYLRYWLEKYGETRLAPKTFEGYKMIIDKHLIPHLGAIRLTDLQPWHIQAYYSEALKKGRLDGKGGLSARTVVQHHRILREALQHAVKWGMLSRNVADLVDVPVPEKKEPEVLTLADTRKLLDRVKNTELYIPVLLAVATGMRRGEILGLRWSDIDFEQGVIKVRQELQRKDKSFIFRQPKTRDSRRVIAMPFPLIEILKEHRAKQEKAKASCYGAYKDLGLVCCRADGSPIVPSTLSGNFKRWIRRNPDLPRVRYHDLRHTHATLLMELKIPAKVVSERLGHATIDITQDLYTHVMPHIQKEAARRLAEALWPDCLSPTEPQSSNPLAVSDVAASEIAFAVQP